VVQSHLALRSRLRLFGIHHPVCPREELPIFPRCAAAPRSPRWYGSHVAVLGAHNSRLVGILLARGDLLTHREICGQCCVGFYDRNFKLDESSRGRLGTYHRSSSDRRSCWPVCDLLGDPGRGVRGFPSGFASARTCRTGRPRHQPRFSSAVIFVSHENSAARLHMKEAVSRT